MCVSLSEVSGQLGISTDLIIGQFRQTWNMRAPEKIFSMGNTLNNIINSLREDGLVAGSRLFVRELYMRKRFWLLEHQLGTNDASGNPPENIRVADASALERIVAAWPKEFWGGHNERYVSRKIAKRFDNEYPCLISERNERVEGAVWCVPFESHCDSQCLKSNDNAFEICNLFVIPSCRGKGIGRQLLEQGEDID